MEGPLFTGPFRLLQGVQYNLLFLLTIEETLEQGVEYVRTLNIFHTLF